MASVNRKAPRQNGFGNLYPYDAFTIKDASVIYTGEMVQLDLGTDKVESAEASPATAAVVLGVSTEYVNNSVSGEVLPWISASIHLMDNSATYVITRDNINDACYVEDAATVALSGSAVAGTIVDVPGTSSPYYGGVFVDFNPAGRAR